MRIAAAVRIGLSFLLATLLVAPAWAVPALDDVVMYEVNLRAFSQAGDLAGVTARLDEIQALGANTLWLMPIHPIGEINRVGELGSPYSVQDYGAVSSEYGGLSGLTTLVDAAHDRGMFVLMDWVANHTAWDHQWITAHPDWYTQDGQGNIIPPAGTNWADVADLNYGSAAMRAAMIGEMQYWVSDVGIDGFRADAADWVPFDFWQQAIPEVRASTSRSLLMLAEGSRSDHYAAGFDLTFGWDFYSTMKTVFNSGGSATILETMHERTYSRVPAGKGILQFTTNHDESAWDATPPVIFGGLDASLAAYAATIAYGGTPLVYNGQEIGWTDNVPFFSRSPLDWTTGQDTSDWYTQLLDVRDDHAALRGGTLNDQSNYDVVLVLREDQGDEVLVVINTRDSSESVSIPVDWQGTWYDQLTGSTEVLASSMTVDPYEVLYLASTRPSDYDQDGDVDVADLLGLQRAGTPQDLADWHAHFGTGSAISNGATLVPEPGSVALLLFAGLVVANRRRCCCG